MLAVHHAKIAEEREGKRANRREELKMLISQIDDTLVKRLEEFKRLEKLSKKQNFGTW